MGVPLRLEGQSFGMLTVIRSLGQDKHRKTIWECKCHCGQTVHISGGNVKRQLSCGCSRIGAIKHNCSGRKGYGIWANIRSRCENPKDKAYVYYGGRGIKLCDRWQDPINFFLDMGEPPKGYSIERIDVNGDYELGNCKWIPRNQQNNNKRNSISFEGLSSKELMAKYGLSEKTVSSRLIKGIPLDQPVQISYKYLEYKGEKLSCREWSEKLGIHPATISWRLRQGWPIDKVLHRG